jgi:Peptidase family M41
MPAPPAFTLDDAQIRSRKRTLESARRQLKDDFVGIDGVIDELCNYVRIWYLMPEILTRPVIVNLWGMTGVGKTDLVRRLVRYLGFQDRFCEVELGGDSFNSTVAGFLTNGGIDDGKPAIVLFDEIQRFATRNPDGSDKDNGGKFADFWELLSDGRLAKRDRSNIRYMLKDRLADMRYQREYRKRHPNPDDPSDPSKNEIGLWDANQLIALGGLQAPPDEVALWTYERMEQELSKIKSSPKVYEPVDHSRTLCIVSGNLDEAFQMAGQAGEADVDADIFAAYTSKITVVDVKNALLRRFRPEQVARFGNIHLIYRSLRRRDFEQLIDREVKRVSARVESMCNVSVSVDASVNSLIYRNGVFPVQGVRPVFSSVIDILETNLTAFLFDALLANAGHIEIRYDERRKQLQADFGGATKRMPFTGRIDDIRQGNKPDVVANVAVHEAGHGVVYAALFGVAPLQLTAKVASSYAAGFTFPHQIHETRDSLIAKIKVLLAGGLAEDLVFGEGHASIGRAHDREAMTVTAAEVVRRYGFDAEFQANYMVEGPAGLDRAVTDADIEKMIARLVAETRQLLRDHQQALVDLAMVVKEQGAMQGASIAEVLSRHGMEAAVHPEGHLLVAGYESLLASD